MWSTDVLREEHRWILRLLECLELHCSRSERDGLLESQSAAELLALCAHFADGLHQEREERYLFPRLLSRARSVAERLEVARLCGEHEQERHAMGRMSQELLGATYGDARSLRGFLSEARQYVALHRQHVLHENRELLPLAEKLLTPGDDEVVMQGFVGLEAGGPQKLRRIFERIDALCVHFRVGAPG